mmetsp:Transcript_69909/g.138397  ORF Transcript_69909/g.138397 Transcript_69909/m.138397 type:complete len:205 (-) Transcript_69909:918-1532(-)
MRRSFSARSPSASRRRGFGQHSRTAAWWRGLWDKSMQFHGPLAVTLNMTCSSARHFLQLKSSGGCQSSVRRMVGHLWMRMAQPFWGKHAGSRLTTGGSIVYRQLLQSSGHGVQLESFMSCMTYRFRDALQESSERQILDVLSKYQGAMIRFHGQHGVGPKPQTAAALQGHCLKLRNLLLTVSIKTLEKRSGQSCSMCRRTSIRL